jgi:hypothetical protein
MRDLTSHPPSVPYSFSMINLIKLMPEWNWPQFDEIMSKAQTKNVELVPGMVLGPEWDQYITQPSAASDALALLMNSYSVTSIQSLTYDLNINLADVLRTNNDVLRRFHSLAHLGGLLKCKVFVLGSPGQKKMNTLYTDPEALKKQFTENCAWFASVLTPSGTLSIEHNTKSQGADYCNTLSDIVDVVTELRKAGIQNVGINLDTKCLIDEFGDSLHLAELIDTYKLETIVTSIQVSLDLLTRSGRKDRTEEKMLFQLAKTQGCPISLEEFGLQNQQLNEFISAWQAAQNSF